MVPVRASVLAVLATRLFVTVPCAAAPADTSATLYALITPPSSLENGCQGLCECPIVSVPTYGSFDLVKTGSDFHYIYYNVERYIASFNNGPGAVFITGSGQYRIDESAAMQEMTLDLQIEGQPTQRFDSGLKPVAVAFPQIDISCAVHGFACYDSVLVVNATPAGGVGVPGSPLPRAGLQTVLPNPFERGATLTITLDRSEPVVLMIVDPAGRRVRVLAAGQLFGPGPHDVTWDGRRDDGRLAPAGVYWALLRWPGGADGRRIVRLE